MPTDNTGIFVGSCVSAEKMENLTKVVDFVQIEQPAMTCFSKQFLLIGALEFLWDETNVTCTATGVGKLAVEVKFSTSFE